MLTLDQIKAALEDAVLKEVERKTGINRTTLTEIKFGRHKNLTLSTFDKLSAYFEALE